MIYLLNSAVIGAGAYGTYTYAPASWAELREVCASDPRPVSRIGYPETAALIESQTGWRPPISREVSPLEPGDVAYVVRLRYRLDDPGRKGGPTGARPDDWEVGRLERLT